MNDKMGQKKFSAKISEQAQVEFLNLLLPYASQQYRVSANALHNIAMDFLETVFKKIGKELPGFKEIDVQGETDSQHLFVTLDHKYLIIIQSNVVTGPSNEALTEQVNRMINSNNMDPAKLFPVLLKTQYEFTVNEDQFIYPLICRRDLLALLFGERTRGIKNNRFNQFRMWLAEIDQEFLSFRDRHPSAWGYKEWIGYSNFMEEEMNWGEWQFRPDEAGGSFEFLNEG
jgi:hypothetical protein